MSFLNNFLPDPLISVTAGPNDPLVNPVSAGRTQQRQPSQHSRCRTLVQSGKHQQQPGKCNGHTLTLVYFLGGLQEVFVREVRE